MSIKEAAQEKSGEGKGQNSFSRILPLATYGTVFTLGILGILTHFIPFIPEVEWESVEGYFEFLGMSLVPTLIPIVIKYWRNNG